MAMLTQPRLAAAWPTAHPPTKDMLPMGIPDWLQPWMIVTLCGAVGYCIGSLKDAHAKLDKLQKQVEHLHNKLYESGAFDRRR